MSSQEDKCVLCKKNKFLGIEGEITSNSKIVVFNNLYSHDNI